MKKKNVYFQEYQEYLELFADSECNLFNDLKPKEGNNAKIFKEALLKSRRKSISIKEKHGSLNRPKSNEEIDKKFQEPSPNSSQPKLPEQSKPVLNHDSSLILSLTYKGDSYHDSNNKSSSFNPSNVPTSYPQTSYSKKNTPFISSTSIKEQKNVEKLKKDHVFPLKKEVKKHISSSALANTNIHDLKEKINKHIHLKPTSNKKEVSFQIDKNFIANRKLQEKKFLFNIRNGLIPSRPLLNHSFGL